MDYKITGIETVPYDGEPRFAGFLLEGVAGAVDPFVEDKLEVAELKGLSQADYLKEELAWAKSQIGKTLSCDELFYQAIATKGPVTITEQDLAAP